MLERNKTSKQTGTSWVLARQEFVFFFFYRLPHCANRSHSIMQRATTYTSLQHTLHTWANPDILIGTTLVLQVATNHQLLHTAVHSTWGQCDPKHWLSDLRVLIYINTPHPYLCSGRARDVGKESILIECSIWAAINTNQVIDHH